MKTLVLPAVAFCFAALLAIPVSAQAPQLLNYQGRVAVGTTNFDGGGQFKFALVNGGALGTPATATATISGGKVTSISVTGAGFGYLTPPVVTITPIGGGSGATATANILNGIVTSITVNTPGSGYTFPPLVSVAAPPAPVFTTYWSNDGTSNLGQEPTGAVALPVAKGLYSVLLGDPALANMTALPASVFVNPDVRLRVWFDDGVNGFQLLSPDQRIAAVGYAMNAASVAANSIESAQIVDGSITGGDLAAGSVTGANLLANTVTNTQIADGTVRLQELDTATVDTRYARRAARVVVVDAAGGGDFTSITAALASIAPTAAAPYAVEVRAGNYVESVVMKSFVHLRGAGRDLVTLSSPVSPGSVPEAAGLRMMGLSGVVVSGITFAPASGGVADFGILDSNSSPIVRDCRFRGFNGAFAADAAGISSTNSSPLIASCEFTSSDETGILLITAKARIHDCLFSGGGFALYGIRNRGSEAQVVGCRFELLDHAILNEIFGPTPARALVTGNRFYRVAKGVRNPAGSTAVVTGNHFDAENTGQSMIGVDNSGSIAVAGNTFRFCQYAVVEAGSAATISGNHIEGCGASGERALSILNANAVLDGNVFANNPHGDLATGGINVRLAKVDGVALDLAPGAGLVVAPKIVAPLGVGASAFNIASDFHVNGKAMLGAGFAASGSQNAGLLNLIVGIEADGAANGIRFYENTSSFSMALGYDGVGSGAANALRIYDSTSVARFTFENGGNLGLGVTSPTARLHVVGDAIITGGLMPGGTAQTMTIGAATIDAPATLDLDAAGNLTVDAGSTLRLEGSTVDVVSSGTMDIDAASNLTVDAANTLRLEGSTINAVASGNLSLQAAGTLSLQGSVVTITGLSALGIGGGAGGFMLGVNGSAAKPGGGSWSALSDARLKKNVQPLAGSLERLLALRGVTFEYNDANLPLAAPGLQTGMIAQEVEQVFPMWVDENTDGHKVLTFRGFEALAVEALRELRTEKDAAIKALRAENAVLRKQLAEQSAAHTTRARAIEERLIRIERSAAEAHSGATDKRLAPQPDMP